MNLCTLKIAICVSFFYVSSSAQSTSATLIKKISGFSHPESVVFNEKNQEYYVSNMADRAEGDGFISRLSLKGELIELKWIKGLKDPKGMLITNGKLYVTNNTELVKINIQNSEIDERIAVEGAISLNDITIDETGNIFISDSGKSAIYLLPTDDNDMMVPENNETKILEYLDSKRLQYANGLFAQNNQLYVAAWGENGKGSLLKVDLESREITKISKKGIGNLDGIQPVGKNAFYISDWATGNIYLAGKNGDLQEVLTSEKSAGDIFFDVEKNQLVLPMNHQNAVWWYQLN
jgi:DNA-binding beta-propeller fold protein YncE